MNGQGPGPGPGQEMQGGRFPFSFGGPGVGFGSPFGGPDVGVGSPFDGPGAGFPFGGPDAGFPFGGLDAGFGRPFGGPGVGFGRPFGVPSVGFGRPFGGPSFGFGGMVPDVFSGIDQFGGPSFKPLFERMFEPPNFVRPFGGPFMNPHAPAFPQNLHEHEHEHEHQYQHQHQHHQHQPSHPNSSRGIIIEELCENDEEEIENDPRKHCISYQEPVVECPDDEATGTPQKKMKMLVPHRNEMHQIQQARPQPQPQSHSFTFQSSSVSYGGANGTYYTSSKTMRTGSDGLTFEECKEADSSTKQAAHRISRGLHDKGHSVTRKLNSDGNVNTVQTLHNLNEDEVVGFEEAWNGKKYLPGWREGLPNQASLGRGSSAKRKYRANLLEA